MQDSRTAAPKQADHDSRARLARARGAVSTAIGGGVAIALLFTVGSWVYGLGTRDPGDVPIIRASTEPAKMRPDDPGGTNAPYQEISSYQLAGSSHAQAAELSLAPPAPEPRREDIAMGKIDAADAQGSRDPATPSVRKDDAGDMDEELDNAEKDAEDPDDRVKGSPPIPPSPPSEDVTEDVAADGSGQAPSLSPVAPRRPSDLEQRMLSAVVAAERSADELAQRAADSAIQVQLAAEADEDAVRSMWQQISRANSDILHDRALAVQTTSSGGKTFYRLRVGPFGDTAEARAVCQALKARGQDCVVARNG